MRQTIYQGSVVDLGLEDVALPGGETITLEIVRHGGGAAVLALDDQQRICLLRQYRHAAGGWLWEIPAGKIDPGEAPEITARRELEEEAGVSAAHWRSLGFVYSTPGFCTERIYLYAASGLCPVPPRHHCHEVIEVHWLPWPQVQAMCRQGEIQDAKTLCALFAAGEPE